MLISKRDRESRNLVLQSCLLYIYAIFYMIQINFGFIKEHSIMLPKLPLEDQYYKVMKEVQHIVWKYEASLLRDRDNYIILVVVINC